MIKNPIKEYNNIADWSLTLVNKKFLLRTLVSNISRFLNKNNHPVKVKLIKDKSLDPGDFTIGGEYDPELDELGQKPLRMFFIINHSRLIHFTITKEKAEALAFHLFETLVHEYTHLRQYRSRKYKTLHHTYKSKTTDHRKLEEMLYLSHPDEIDAYSNNIAARLYINQVILNITKDKDHLDLTTYYKVFGKSSPVVQELKKQINSKLTLLKEKYNGKNKRNVRRPQLGNG